MVKKYEKRTEQVKEANKLCEDAPEVLGEAGSKAKIDKSSDSADLVKIAANCVTPR